MDELLFRPILEEDIEILYAKIFSDKDVMRYTFFERTFTHEETERFIKDHFSKDKEGLLGLAGVHLKSSDTLIGFAGILEFDYKNAKEYEFGFVLAKEFWGKGYATKIGKAQIDFAFNDMGLERIFALVNKDNLASKRVIAKLGLKYIGDIKVKDRGTREVFRVNKRGRHNGDNETMAWRSRQRKSG